MKYRTYWKYSYNAEEEPGKTESAKIEGIQNFKRGVGDCQCCLGDK